MTEFHISGPLTLALNLPSAVLVGGEAAALCDELAPLDATWFTARPAHVEAQGAEITAWSAQNGKRAVPIVPNSGNSRFCTSPPAGFVFQTGVHCGLSLRHIAPSAAQFSVAVRYSAPDEDARTLLSVNTGQANNMIFLSDSDGLITAKDKGNALSVELAAPVRGPEVHLLILSFTGRELALSADGRLASAEGRPADMDRPADLFIGCRSNRAGLTKTLGAARIQDVIFWPDRALLHSAAAEDIACLEALSRYHRWTR